MLADIFTAHKDIIHSVYGFIGIHSQHLLSGLSETKGSCEFPTFTRKPRSRNTGLFLKGFKFFGGANHFTYKTDTNIFMI